MLEGGAPRARSACAADPKGLLSCDVPRTRRPGCDSVGVAPQAPAHRAGDRRRDRRRAGPRPSRSTSGSSSSHPDARPRTVSPRRTGSSGELASAREHYQTALALDPTNRIAERNIDRLRILLVEAGEKTVAGPRGQQGARRDLRGGDRQDRLRLPDRPGRLRSSSPRSTPATRSSSRPKAVGWWRSPTGCASASWSPGSRRACSS